MAVKQANAYTQPSFGLGHRSRRAVWNLVHALLFRPSPRFLHGWRSMLLRAFGARLGKGCHVYPGARIWAPWNLNLGDHVGVADGAILYCMDRMEIGSYAVISQGAHLCGGTHDFNSPGFQLVTKPIKVGAFAWVCADAFIHPGVHVAEGVVIGARAVATKDIPQAWTVHAGYPAVEIGVRDRDAVLGSAPAHLTGRTPSQH